MIKVFISQPMRGKTEQEIMEERERAIKAAMRHVMRHVEGDTVKVLESYFACYQGMKPLFYLGKSIELLSEADIAYFAQGWENARGCRIENTCAKEYGLYVIEDNGENEAIYVPEECPLP